MRQALPFIERVFLGWLAFLFAVSTAHAGSRDACSYLFDDSSPYLVPQRCDLDAARALLAHQLTEGCKAAASSGQAESSMARLATIAKTPDEQSACSTEKRLLSLFALCTLRPPNHRDDFRLAFLKSQFSYDREGQPLVPLECARSLLLMGDEDAMLDFALVLWPADRLPYLRQLLAMATPGRDDQAARLLRAAYAYAWKDRDALHRLLCGRHRAASRALQSACAEFRGDEEALQMQAAQHAALQQSQRTDLPLRIGLTILSIAVAGTQLGVSAAYPGTPAGQAMATFGGITASSLAVTDAMLIDMAPDRTGAARYFKPITLFFGVGIWAWLPIPIALSGAAANWTAQTPTGNIVSSAISAPFSLASALALIWMF